MKSLDSRMKNAYEFRYRHYLPRRSYVIIRIDQKAGHTYTKNLEKPFDEGYIKSFDAAAQALVKEIQGARFAYVQSDECSVLLTDFDTVDTEAWFDNNIQKIVSVSASIFTAEFNKAEFMNRLGAPDYWKDYNYYSEDSKSEYDRSLFYYDPGHLQSITSHKAAYFDSRVFQIPDREEVGNYFWWRCQDCFKNCISSYAQSVFNHKELHGKTTEERIQMLYEQGFNNIRQHHKYGRVITRDGISPAWRFAEDREKLMNLIPVHGY